jgi:hypothetical protein
MYHKTEMETTLDLAVTSLLRVKGGAYTTGVLECLLNSVLNSNGVTDEVKADLVARVAQAAVDHGEVPVVAQG